MLPHRKDGLLVQEIGAETIIYDSSRHRAHCLNAMARVVLDQCDGTNSVKQLAAVAAAELKVPVSEEAIWFALEELAKAKLLREDLPQRKKSTGHTRRELGRKFAVGGISAVVASILVPTVAQAASCAHTGQSCGTGGPPFCCAGCNCTGNSGFKTCTNGIC